MPKQVDGSKTAETVPLSVVALDLPAPPAGWGFELERRGIPIVPDDIGRPSISRDAARDLLTEHREDEARKARRRVEIEQRAIEADQAFRAQLWGGLPAGEIPPGMTAAELLMASDPESRESRRESLVEHALRNTGELVYQPIGGQP